MRKYVYPDKGDSLTCLFISSNSDEKYWADSEKNVLDMIIKKISSLDNKPDFLDLGCGFGRLFSVFYPYVNSITGLEPDTERFNESKKEAERIDKNKICVFNNDISYVTQKKFDAVLVSHIFQHVPFDVTNSIFKHLSDIINVNGYLFITTTFTDTKDDIFTLEYLKNNKHFSEIVSEKDFIQRFNDNGILPVREFSPYTMKKLFNNYKFELEKMFVYHFDVASIGHNKTIEYDNMMNNSGTLQNAKDVLYILRRRK